MRNNTLVARDNTGILDPVHRAVNRKCPPPLKLSCCLALHDNDKFRTTPCKPRIAGA